MSQELNICHYYLLVLFDFEAAQWPVSAGFIPPPSVVRFKVDYSNPRAPDSAKSWSFLSFAHSLPPPLSPPSSSLHHPKWNYIHLLAQSITNVHALTGVHTHLSAAFCRQRRSRSVLLCRERRCASVHISLGFSHHVQLSPSVFVQIMIKLKFKSISIIRQKHNLTDFLFNKSSITVLFILFQGPAINKTLKCLLSVNSVMMPVVASQLLNLPPEKSKKTTRGNNISSKTIFHLASSVFIHLFSSQTYWMSD